MDIIRKLEAAITMDTPQKSPFKVPPTIKQMAMSSQVVPSPTVEGILEERSTTHGSFADNARISQTLKSTIYSTRTYDKMSDIQREAIEMICLKMSRIVSGNPNEVDHWNDIAGYAKLAAKAIEDARNG